MTDISKVPTRPGSKWATGKRRVGDAPRERAGFVNGARVKRSAPPQVTPKVKHRRKRK